MHRNMFALPAIGALVVHSEVGTPVWQPGNSLKPSNCTNQLAECTRIGEMFCAGDTALGGPEKGVALKKRRGNGGKGKVR